MATTKKARIKAGRRTIDLSNPDKILWPDEGYTKTDLVDYYRTIAPTMEAYVAGRLLTLERFPDGIDGKRFFQKDAPAYFPDWIERKTVGKRGGRTVDHVVGDGPTLVYLATQAVITVHMSLNTAGDLERPDQIVFDLDPSTDDFSVVKRAAHLTRELLEDLGLVPFVKTSGSRGLHLTVPVKGATYAETRPFARDVMSLLARDYPDELTVEGRKEKRKGRLFLDWMRNSAGATVVAPYSVRPLPGAPVAVTLDWDEVDAKRFGPRDCSMKDVIERTKSDPWKGWRRRARSLSTARSRLTKLLAD